MLVGCVFLLSCEKEEDRITFTGGTAPVLTVSTTTAQVLDAPVANFSSLQLNWTNPDYSFSNGVNTQDVNYTLQIDVEGQNFSSPKMINLPFTNTTSRSFTVKELNGVLSGLELPDYQQHRFQFRVRATLSNGSVPLFSNVVTVPVTTYLDVVYPVPARLFITGGATPAGWMGGGDAIVPAQEFTKVNSYLFEISSIQLTGGGSFLFVPVYGNWSAKYGFSGSNNENNPAGDFFRPEGGDMRAPANTKAYKITVNFKTGKYSVE